MISEANEHRNRTTSIGGPSACGQMIIPNGIWYEYPMIMLVMYEVHKH